MKTKATVIVFMAITAGVFAYTRPHNAVPSDLRDAVADNREFDTAIPDVTKDAGDIPVPPAVAANVRKSITWPTDRKFVAQNYDKVDELATKILMEKDKALTPKNWVKCYEKVLMKLIKVPGWHGGLIPPSYNPDEVVKVFPSYPDMTSFGESEALATLMSVNQSLFTVYQRAAEKFPQDFPGFFSEVSKPAFAIYYHVKGAKSLADMRYAAASVSEWGANNVAVISPPDENNYCRLYDLNSINKDSPNHGVVQNTYNPVKEPTCVYRCASGIPIDDYPLRRPFTGMDYRFPLVTLCPQYVIKGWGPALDH